MGFESIAKPGSAEEIPTQNDTTDQAKQRQAGCGQIADGRAERPGNAGCEDSPDEGYAVSEECGFQEPDGRNGKLNLVADSNPCVGRRSQVENGWLVRAGQQPRPAAFPGGAACARRRLVNDDSDYAIADGFYDALGAFHEWVIAETGAAPNLAVSW